MNATAKVAITPIVTCIIFRACVYLLTGDYAMPDEAVIVGAVVVVAATIGAIAKYDVIGEK